MSICGPLKFNLIQELGINNSKLKFNEGGVSGWDQLFGACRLNAFFYINESICSTGSVFNLISDASFGNCFPEQSSRVVNWRSSSRYKIVHSVAEKQVNDI